MTYVIFLCKKTQIKIDNYITPIPHPSIYPSRIFLAYEQVYSSIFSKSSSSPRINLLTMAFKHMDQIIDHNECNHVITQQHNQGTKALVLIETIPNHPSLSLIIWENQTHIDLAKYLHSACFCQ